MPSSDDPKYKKNNAFPELTADDYYLDEYGLVVFTEAYHRKRGYCCKSGCRHCPYGYKKDHKNAH